MASHLEAGLWLESNGIHRRALLVAARHFNDLAGYVRGDCVLIERIAAHFGLYSALLELPEWEAALTERQFRGSLNERR